MPGDTKTIIMDNMRELVIKSDFDKISIQSITDNCKLTRAAFYYHFDNKFDLIEKIFIYDVGNSKISSYDELLTYTKSMLITIYEYQKYYYKIFKVAEFNVFLYNYFSEFSDGYICSNHKDSECEDDKLSFIAKIINFSIVGILVKWSMSYFKEEPDIIFENFLFFISSVKKGINI